MNEILNIISESYTQSIVGGPNKVIFNTLKGFDLIGYPYVLNKNINNYKYNWIHDSKKALIEAAVKKIPAIVGPNLFVLPKDFPRLMPSIKHCLYLHPSNWCIDVWKKLGYADAKLSSWPSGIDTERFNLNREKVNPKQVMVYFKRRDPAILELVKKKLIDNGFEPKVVVYGQYNEQDFIETIRNSSFAVWITISESQGIALQETLSTGCPIIVFNVKSLFEAVVGKNYIFPERLRNVPASSAPYFDNRCGIIIDDLVFLDAKIKEMSSKIHMYKPREFILENLSLEKMAIKLISFFNHLDFTNYTVKNDISENTFKMSIKGKIIFKAMILNRKFQTLIGNRWTTD